MSTLSPKDRVSLCMFTFADGRRCRTPRTGKNPHFCFDHAQKEARALAEESLSKDLAYFFSGDYLSACDLSTALGRLIPAVIRGDVEPKTARTVAYMAQILLQSIQISRHEYINAFDTDNWRDSIRKSVKGNYHHRFPPAPTTTGANSSAPEPARPQTQPQQPAPPPRTPMPPTSAEFVQHVVAGLQTGGGQVPQPAPTTQSVETPAHCHSERSEEPASSSNPSLATHLPRPGRGHSPLPQSPQPAPSLHTPLPPTSAEFVQHVLAGRNSSRPPRKTGVGPQLASAPPQSDPPASPVCHPERSEGSQPNHPGATTDRPQPPAQLAPPTTPTPQPACPEQGRRDNSPQPRPSTEPDRSAPWRNFGDSFRIPPDSKLL